MVVSQPLQREQIASLTVEEIGAMDRESLFDVISAFHGSTGSANAASDHRQFLAREQLERLVYLVRSQCQA